MNNITDNREEGNIGLCTFTEKTYKLKKIYQDQPFQNYGSSSKTYNIQGKC